MRMPAGRGAFPGAVDRGGASHAAQPQPATHGHRDVGPGPRAGVRLSCWPNRSIAEQPERTALDLFDRLRLREPFAHAFAALGFEGEEAWRVAARIKVLLLVGAGVGSEAQPATAAEIEAVEASAARSNAGADKVSAAQAVGAPEPARACRKPALSLPNWGPKLGSGNENPHRHCSRIPKRLRSRQRSGSIRMFAGSAAFTSRTAMSTSSASAMRSCSGGC